MQPEFTPLGILAVCGLVLAWLLISAVLWVILRAILIKLGRWPRS